MFFLLLRLFFFSFCFLFHVLPQWATLLEAALDQGELNNALYLVYALHGSRALTIEACQAAYYAPPSSQDIDFAFSEAHDRLGATDDTQQQWKGFDWPSSSPHHPPVMEKAIDRCDANVPTSFFAGCASFGSVWAQCLTTLKTNSDELLVGAASTDVLRVGRVLSSIIVTLLANATGQHQSADRLAAVHVWLMAHQSGFSLSASANEYAKQFSFPTL
jgi:hypothetical protein